MDSDEYENENELEDLDHDAEEDEEDEEIEKHGHSRLIVTNEGVLDPSILTRTEGYMYKKGGAVNARGGFRNWKKRWFVLAPVEFLGHEAYELQYYDAPDGNLKGTVSLSDVSVYSEQRSDNKKVKYEFQLVLQNGGILQLSCDSEEERQEWIDTLEIIIEYLGKITTSGAMTLDGYDPLCEDEEESYRIGEEIGQNCQAYGPGLFGSESGKPSQFAIQIFDSVGQKVTKGGMPITATISNEAALYYVAILDNSDGSYFAHYTLGRAGKYELAIKLNDEHHIFGSPFDIEVLPSKTNPSFCYAEGDCLDKTTSSKPLNFKIFSMDSFGNRKLRGGDPFEVSIVGPATLVDLQDLNDGSYECSLRLTSQPSSTNIISLMVFVTLYGRPIKGSPFKPMISEDTISKMSPFTSPIPLGNNSKVPMSPLISQPTPSLISEPRGTPSNQSLKLQELLSPQGKISTNPSISTQSQLPLPPSQPPRNQLNQTNFQGNQSAPISQMNTTQDNTPLSRLERSRQRAILAKSLAENKANESTINNATSSSISREPVLNTTLSASSTSNLKTTKLSQLAQRSAATLQAMKQQNQQTITQTKESTSTPVDPSRTAFIQELRNQLRLGLGQQSNTLPVNITPAEQDAWDVTHFTCQSNEKAINILFSKLDTLQSLFSLFSDRIENISVLKLVTTHGNGGIFKMFELYDIIPNYATRIEIKNIFNLVLLSQRILRLPASMVGGGNGIDFSCFLRFLMFITQFILSKTNASSTVYSSVEAKLDILVNKWAFGDSNKLQTIRKDLASAITI